LGGLPALGGAQRNLRGKRDLGRYFHRARFLEVEFAADRLVAAAEIQGMRVSVGDVRLPFANALAPLGEIDLVHFAELHVDAPLADPAAADAGEIGLAAGLQREAAIHDVIPAVPLRHASGVHGADEIADAHCGRDANLLRPD